MIINLTYFLKSREGGKCPPPSWHQHQHTVLNNNCPPYFTHSAIAECKMQFKLQFVYVYAWADLSLSLSLKHRSSKTLRSFKTFCDNNNNNNKKSSKTLQSVHAIRWIEIDYSYKILLFGYTGVIKKSLKMLQLP